MKDIKLWWEEASVISVIALISEFVFKTQVVLEEELDIDSLGVDDTPGRRHRFRPPLGRVWRQDITVRKLGSGRLSPTIGLTFG